MSERAYSTQPLTIQVRTATASGFEKNAASWATDTTKGVRGLVTAQVVSATDRQVERAQARGEVASRTIIAPAPLNLIAGRHRFVTAVGTAHRVVEANEFGRAGVYVTVEDTT